MKMKKSNLGNNQSLFQPTFGNRPEQYIGRDGVIDQFVAGLKEPIGSRNRCTLFLGQRGMGKTALLLELSDRAQKEGYDSTGHTCCADRGESGRESPVEIPKNHTSKQ